MAFNDCHTCIYIRRSHDILGFTTYECTIERYERTPKDACAATPEWCPLPERVKKAELERVILFKRFKEGDLSENAFAVELYEIMTILRACERLKKNMDQK